MGKILKGATLVDGKWIISANPQSAEIAPPEAPEPVAEPAAPPDPMIDLEALFAQAQAEIDRTMAEARAEAERLREAARKEGHEEGYAKGEAQGMAEWKVRVEAVAQEAASLVEARKSWLRDAEADVVRLALLTAERILYKEARDPETVRALIHGVLQQLGDESVVRLKVSPSDAPGLLENPPLPGVPIIADPLVGMGGVAIEAQASKVDARFALQFREMAAAILMTEPEDDPVLAPALEALQTPLDVPQAPAPQASVETSHAPMLPAPLESTIPAADPAWKPV